VGALPPPSTRLAHRFDLVVVCAPGIDDPARAYGVTALEIPFRDDRGPVPYAVFDAAGDVARALRRGQRVLVACAMGRNRSALVAALALHKLTRAPGRVCRERIAAARPGVFTNMAFARLLEETGRRARTVSVRRGG
jgi:hypothetical protein